MDDINNIYYDRKVKRFVQLRISLTDGWICGGHCKYYNDAITNICITRLSNKYIKENLEEVKYVDNYAVNDGFGWIVKGEDDGF